jgi:hypothetical protein
MELLVATWTVRLVLVGSSAVAAISLLAGTTVIESVDRAAVAAFVFTAFGRQLISWLETPEQRMRRLRARRDMARKLPAPPRERKKRAERPVGEAKGAPAPDDVARTTHGPEPD